MEREFLKAWTIFRDRSSKLFPKLEEMVHSENKNLNGQLQSLLAINSCRMDSPALREDIVKNCLLGLTVNDAVLHNEATMAGIQGLALSGKQTKASEELAKVLASKLNI
jgi:hypothetical protein